MTDPSSYSASAIL